MKFMTIVTTSNPEKAGPPPPALFRAIGELGMQAGKALQDNGAIATIGVVKVEGGELIVDGPYSEANQPVGDGFAVYDVESKKEAIDWDEEVPRAPSRALASLGGSGHHPPDDLLQLVTARPTRAAEPAPVLHTLMTNETLQLAGQAELCRLVPPHHPEGEPLC